MNKGKYKLPKESVAELNIRQEDQLLVQYQNNNTIIDHLSEIPVTLQTYEFLGELFFNYTFRELGEHPPSDQWKTQLKTIRNDVYQLFELARAARALKQINTSAQKD
ncbi:hypothetical protein SanaruYs_29450 [Chryseotalea sanaruensis]|uniref:Uncharacterized protein n=1 Tax=Chryseotalea sanaruensis TaxID=2482724 RepID=A0A401UCT7_9BACT|nr:hypothetical protein [Chryseotalea sanaruensis]GCC52707.1 hypothetical protein SanaruYs_29450 [Chryseotalea sanaruensis]